MRIVIITMAFIAVACDQSSPQSGDNNNFDKNNIATTMGNNASCNDLYSGLDPSRLINIEAITQQGFYKSSDGYVDNKKAAGILDNPDAWLERFEKWQRMGGYSAVFKNQNEGTILIDVEVYNSCQGAKQAYSGHVKSFDEQFSTISRSNNPSVASTLDKTDNFNSMPDAKYFHAKFQAIDQTISIDTMSALFRQDNVFVIIAWKAFNANVFLSDFKSSVSKQSEYIQEAKIVLLQDVETFSSKAITAFNEERWGESIKNASALLKINPNDTEMAKLIKDAEVKRSAVMEQSKNSSRIIGTYDVTTSRCINVLPQRKIHKNGLTITDVNVTYPSIDSGNLITAWYGNISDKVIIEYNTARIYMNDTITNEPYINLCTSPDNEWLHILKKAYQKWHDKYAHKLWALDEVNKEVWVDVTMPSSMK